MVDDTDTDTDTADDGIGRDMAATHDAASRFATRLVGLTRPAASDLAAAEGRFDVHFVVEGDVVTLDFRPARIRATVTDDVVVSATAG